jgi:hypothetical protein
MSRFSLDALVNIAAALGLLLALPGGVPSARTTWRCHHDAPVTCRLQVRQTVGREVCP